MTAPQKITPCLWFDNNAEEAIEFYCSVFKNSRLISVMRNGEGGPGPKGSLLAARFEIEGQQIEVINGGPVFKLSEAVSLAVRCHDQQEVDFYWAKLIEGGGAESQCGWLKDRFGLSWQIVPGVLYELLQHPDAAVAARVMQAMLKMRKIDIALLQVAAALQP